MMAYIPYKQIGEGINESIKNSVEFHHTFYRNEEDDYDEYSVFYYIGVVGVGIIIGIAIGIPLVLFISYLIN